MGARASRWGRSSCERHTCPSLKFGRTLKSKTARHFNSCQSQEGSGHSAPQEPHLVIRHQEHPSHRAGEDASGHEAGKSSQMEPQAVRATGTHSPQNHRGLDVLGTGSSGHSTTLTLAQASQAKAPSLPTPMQVTPRRTAQASLGCSGTWARPAHRVCWWEFKATQLTACSPTPSSQEPSRGPPTELALRRQTLPCRSRWVRPGTARKCTWPGSSSCGSEGLRTQRENRSHV